MEPGWVSFIWSDWNTDIETTWTENNTVNQDLKCEKLSKTIAWNGKRWANPKPSICEERETGANFFSRQVQKSLA